MGLGRSDGGTPGPTKTTSEALCVMERSKFKLGTSRELDRVLGGTY